MRDSGRESRCHSDGFASYVDAGWLEVGAVGNGRKEYCNSDDLTTSSTGLY